MAASSEAAAPIGTACELPQPSSRRISPSGITPYRLLELQPELLEAIAGKLPIADLATSASAGHRNRRI